jgi:cysteine-rich repeat protein
MKKGYLKILLGLTLPLLAVACSGNGSPTPTQITSAQENQTEPPPATPLNLCGNGQVNAGEDCDDGNTIDGDGCSHDCRTEGKPSDLTTGVKNGSPPSGTDNDGSVPPAGDNTGSGGSGNSVESNLDICTDLYLNYFYGGLPNDAKENLKKQVEEVWRKHMKGISLENCAIVPAKGEDFHGFQESTTNLRNFFMFIYETAGESFQYAVKNLDKKVFQFQNDFKSAMRLNDKKELNYRIRQLETDLNLLAQDLADVQWQLKDIARIYHVQIDIIKSISPRVNQLIDNFSRPIFNRINDAFQPQALPAQEFNTLVNDLASVLINASFHYKTKDGDIDFISFMFFDPSTIQNLTPETAEWLPKGSMFGGFETEEVVLLAN